MTLTEAQQLFLKELKDTYDPDEVFNVNHLVIEKLTGIYRPSKNLIKEIVLTPEHELVLSSIIDRLKNNEPIQYILEEAWFGGMKLKVNKHVLIPRPETEELADWVIKEAANQSTVLDIGTGSGCIAIAIKKKIPNSLVSAIDVCSDALFIASENSVIQETDIEFLLIDFLVEEKWSQLGKYDIIVSNPPYVMQKEIDSIHEKVKTYEPHLALFVQNDDALIFYKKLADFSTRHLNSNGKLYVEINEKLGADVLKLFKSKGFETVEIRKDMQGKDRMVKAISSV